jgi:hypothetical protein
VADQYQVVVIGSGSAGSEACLAAARAGLSTWPLNVWFTLAPPSFSDVSPSGHVPRKLSTSFRRQYRMGSPHARLQNFQPCTRVRRRCWYERFGNGSIVHVFRMIRTRDGFSTFRLLACEILQSNCSIAVFSAYCSAGLFVTPSAPLP